MTKSLIIVESPAKSRTLQRYLGKTYEVKASVGHVRDLPVNTLGVDIEHDFTPKYETIRGKEKIINDLKKSAKKADIIYLAPDPDREGEAIACHIAESLKSVNKPFQRVLFHELTQKAIVHALKHATDINQRLFEAQQARRILDRLVGYKISPILWKKVRRGLSAGRVQSVAVRMICEREKEIQAFIPEEYWTINSQLQGKQPPPFSAQLDKIEGKKAKISDEENASRIRAELKELPFKVAAIQKKKKRRNPAPPFITSTMQIDANRKLRFSAKKTMTIAQKLYEGIEIGDDGPTGLITYMRTDSTRINDDALSAVREFIGKHYSQEHLPAKPNLYKTNKSAQDAHEAIRPTDVRNTPEKMRSFLSKDMLNLYTLIWKRFVASQMAPAILDQTTVSIEAGRYHLKAVGSIMRFLGFMSLYMEAEEESGPEQKAPGSDKDDSLLPELSKGDLLALLNIEAKQHFTQPPPRYTEATLVKALEDNGVGRPSTYAAILSTIQDKEYVELENRKFFPTELGILITEFLLKHFPDIMNIKFTASMEEKLDLVEEGKIEWLKILKDFYSPFAEALEEAKVKGESVKKKAVETDIDCQECDGKMVIRWGRNGEFLACENFPKCKFTQNFKKDEQGNVQAVPPDQQEESEEKCDKCGLPMVYKQGKFGRFLACSGYPKCKNIKSESIGVTCPEKDCGGELIKKLSKKGKVFYSCSNYPKCTFASWDKPINETCPDCDSAYLVEKATKRSGLMIRCPNKKCKYSRKVE